MTLLTGMSPIGKEWLRLIKQQLAQKRMKESINSSLHLLLLQYSLQLNLYVTRTVDLRIAC